MTSLSLAGAFSAPQVNGLDLHTQGLLDELVAQWVAKVPRNIERWIYLDGKNRLKNLAISIPPHMEDELATVCGWPEKAVYTLANRIKWDGVTSSTGDTDPFGLRQAFRDNRFATEMQQAVADSLTHSCAFVTTTRGDRAAGEPDVLVMMHSALWATGLWSRTARALRAGLLVNEVDKLGMPTRMTVLTPAEAVVCVKGKVWYVEGVHRHGLDRAPIESLPFRPTLNRPFGRSRIDRRVRSLTDRAMRAGARLELHGEVYSAQKLFLLGADESAFQDQNGNPVPMWTWYMGLVNALSKDEDGDVPKIEKIAAETPEPHIATIRQLAAEFSGHTGIPLGSLGITTDNPSSAQAINEVREELIIEAQVAAEAYDGSLSRVYENIVMLRDGLTEPPAEMLDVSTKWRNPARPSVVSQSDAMIKQISGIPWLAETRVALEELGYSAEQITRLLADKQRAAGGTLLDRVLAAGQATAPTPAAHATAAVNADAVEG